MWLHIPSSVYSAGLECSTLPCDAQFQALALSVSWRGKLQRPQSWRRVWKTAACAKLLSGPTLEPSTAARLMGEWMASLAASPAPISASPDAKPGSTETPADCISSTCESFAKFSPDGSLLKTSSQFSLFQQEERYSENLPRSGSMRNGELFERPMLAPRIDGTGRSSWHTPRANECEEGAETFVKRNGDRGEHCFSGLSNQIANWPTPRSEDSESCGNHPGAVDSLTGATQQWATPNCRDDHNPSTPDSPRTQRKLEQGWTIDLNEQAAWWTTPQAHDASGGSPDRVGRFGTKHGGANLADDVTLWKTPDVPNGGRTMSAEEVAANGATDKGKRQVGLENQTKVWPTPNARDGDKWNNREPGHHRQVNLSGAANFHSSRPAPETQPHGSESLPSGSTLRRRLNPNFVDWLMSLPPGWTDYAPVETESWFSRVRSRLEYLLNARG